MPSGIDDRQRATGLERRATGRGAAPRANRRDWLTPANMSEKCFGAFATAGPQYDKALGIIAHILIEADYERAMNVTRGEQLFVDDQFAGSVNPRYARFILERNPHLDAKAKEKIRKGGYRRPDLLLHDVQLLEFEEIKPASDAGKKEGQRQILEIWNWMRSVGLTYDFGRNYSPQGRAVQILEFKLVGVPVEVYLRPERFVPGLIIYRYCIRTDWNKLLKRAVVGAFIALLVWLLSRTGIPGPLPNPMPTPTPVPILPPVPTPPLLPSPTPQPDPIRLPPVREPIRNSERSLPDAPGSPAQSQRPQSPQPDYSSLKVSNELRIALASLDASQIRNLRLS